MDIRILQLLRRDFTGKSTRRLGECVLGGDFGWALEFGLDFEEVEGGGGDDDLVGAVEFGFVDGADNLLDGREGAVHLEVTAGYKSQHTACFAVKLAGRTNPIKNFRGMVDIYFLKSMVFEKECKLKVQVQVAFCFLCRYVLREGKRGGAVVGVELGLVRRRLGWWFRQLAASSGAPEPERPIMPSEAWVDYVYIYHVRGDVLYSFYLNIPSRRAIITKFMYGIVFLNNQ